MRRFVTAGFLALTVALLAGCSDQDKDSPTEPQFGKPAPAICLSDAQALLKKNIATHSEWGIEALFADRKSKRGAYEIVNNITRKLCKEPRQYADALNMAWDFAYLVWRQMPDKLMGDAEDAAMLTSAVFAFASDPNGPPPLEIPDGAYEETGGIIQFDAGDASLEFPIVAATNNEEAAVVVDNPYAFGPAMPTVTIALSRIPDYQQPIPGFLNFAERYDVISSHQPDPSGDGVLVALCVPDDQDLPDNLAIAHYYLEQVEILVPVGSSSAVDCTDAATGYPFDLGPGVIGSAGRILRPVLDRIFGVKPLHAMFFSGKGLTGRTKSFSPFVPVEVVIDIDETVQLTVGYEAEWSSSDIEVVSVDPGTGLATGEGGGPATVTALVDGLDSYHVLIEVLAPTNTTVATAPLALLGSLVEDTIRVSPAPPAGSLVELVDSRASGVTTDTTVLPDASGTVIIPVAPTFEPRSLTANFLGATGLAPSTAGPVVQHVVQRFDDRTSLDGFLGGAVTQVEDFEGYEIFDPIENIILRQLNMYSTFGTLVVRDCVGSKGAFGSDATTRVNGEGRYDLLFTEEASKNVLGFDIGCQDPSTGPATVDVNTGVGSVSLSVLNTQTEDDPVFVGVAATLELQSVVVHEGTETSGSGNEEVLLDNILIANTLP